MRTRGQLQPIRVRWDEEEGLYVMICGERALAGRPPGRLADALLCHRGRTHRRERIAGPATDRECPARGSPADRAGPGVSLPDGPAPLVEPGTSPASWSLTQSTVVKALALLELPGPGSRKGRARSLVAGHGVRGVQARGPVRAGHARHGNHGRVLDAGSGQRAGAATVRPDHSGQGGEIGRPPQGQGGPVVLRTAVGVTVTLARTRGKAPLDNTVMLAALDEVRTRLENTGESDQAA